MDMIGWMFLVAITAVSIGTIYCIYRAIWDPEPRWLTRHEAAMQKIADALSTRDVP